MSQTAIELKPCPFCGGKAHEVHQSGTAWFIGVDHADNCQFADFQRTEAEAIVAWNRRAALSATQGGVKVKELEWVKPPLSETLSRCDTELGTYRVWTHHEANGKWFWSLEGGYNEASGEANSESAAKAAAQQDYETRIRSAITLQGEPLHMVRCDICNGEGTEGLHNCRECSGRGTILSPLAHQPVTASWEKALEPFALISSEGVVTQKEGHVTITTCAEYFHRAAAALKSEGRK